MTGLLPTICLLVTHLLAAIGPIRPSFAADAGSDHSQRVLDFFKRSTPEAVFHVQASRELPSLQRSFRCFAVGLTTTWTGEAKTSILVLLETRTGQVMRLGEPIPPGIPFTRSGSVLDLVSIRSSRRGLAILVDKTVATHSGPESRKCCLEVYGIPIRGDAVLLGSYGSSSGGDAGTGSWSGHFSFRELPDGRIGIEQFSRFDEDSECGVVRKIEETYRLEAVGFCNIEKVADRDTSRVEDGQGPISDICSGTFEYMSGTMQGKSISIRKRRVYLVGDMGGRESTGPNGLRCIVRLGRTGPRGLVFAKDLEEMSRFFSFDISRLSAAEDYLGSDWMCDAHLDHNRLVPSRLSGRYDKLPDTLEALQDFRRFEALRFLVAMAIANSDTPNSIGIRAEALLEKHFSRTVTEETWEVLTWVHPSNTPQGPAWNKQVIPSKTSIWTSQFFGFKLGVYRHGSELRIFILHEGQRSNNVQ